MKRIVCVVMAALSVGASASTAAEPSPERVRELVRMVRQDCGSCHGMTLNGGLGPALTAEALKVRDVPKAALVATIVGGRPGTPMPPWHRFVSEAEADWIVDRLLEGFPAQ
ncbi:MAG: cytochrome c [Rhodocyclales bacterium]|nr:cytochrome c [Rhodocyclales bacterium]